MPEARQIVPDGGVRAGLNTDSATLPKHRIVREHTLTDSVRLCTDANQNPKGVTMQAIAVGVTGDIQIAGKCVLEAGAAVAKEALVGSDSVGRAITVTDPGDFVVGKAVTPTTTGAGDLIEVEMSCRARARRLDQKGRQQAWPLIQLHKARRDPPGRRVAPAAPVRRAQRAPLARPDPPDPRDRPGPDRAPQSSTSRRTQQNRHTEEPS